MNTAELIYQESKELPEFEAREVLDFATEQRRPIRTSHHDLSHHRLAHFTRCHHWTSLPQSTL